MCLWLWVSAQWSSSTLWGRCPAVVKCIISRKVDWTLGADWMASLLSESNSDGCFLWGYMKEHVYAVPSRAMEDLARLQASARTVNAKMLKRAWENAMWQMHCHLLWNGCRLLQTPITATLHPWFDHLIASDIWWWCVSWKLHVTGNMLYNIFDLLFTRNHTMESLWANFVSSCI
jgi:hypothetical protein